MFLGVTTAARLFFWWFLLTFDHWNLLAEKIGFVKKRILYFFLEIVVFNSLNRHWLKISDLIFWLFSPSHRLRNPVTSGDPVDQISLSGQQTLQETWDDLCSCTRVTLVPEGQNVGARSRVWPLWVQHATTILWLDYYATLVRWWGHRAPPDLSWSRVSVCDGSRSFSRLVTVTWQTSEQQLICDVWLDIYSFTRKQSQI